MAFNTVAPRVEYIASASQSIFTFLFKIYSKTDIVVYQTPSGDIPNDVADLLTVDVDYTVTVDGDNGGLITLTTPAGSGDALTILRSLPQERDVEYQTNGDLLAETLNEDQNYQTYLIADNLSNNSRHVTLPQNAQNVSNVLPNPLGEQYIRWNASGTALVNDDTVPLNVQTAIEQAWIAEAEAMTADSYAKEPYNTHVKEYTSNGDGTFTATTTAYYSSLHYSVIAGQGINQFLGTGTTKGIQYMSKTSAPNETIIVPANTSAFSIETFTLDGTTSIVLEDGATYKIL